MKPLRRLTTVFALACALHALPVDIATVTRAGPRQLVWLGGDLVLDWDPPTGNHLLWHYQATAQGAADPLPGNPVVTGTWASIRTGHELAYLGGDVVLDWEPFTGKFRLWSVHRDLTGEVDPFPGPPLASGSWQSIRTGHRLVYLGSVAGGAHPDRVLDWEPGTGHYRVWIYDRTMTGASDPFLSKPVTEGYWNSIHTGHELVALEGGRVIDWEPQTGHYRVWTFNPLAQDGQDPLPAPAHNEGIWESVRAGHTLIPLLGRARVLDWEPVTGRNRVWPYSASATGATDPLPSPTATDWTWKSVRSSIQPVATASLIKHVVLIVQENHSFDSYFGNYCTAPTGSNPVCTGGPSCCEAAPAAYGNLQAPDCASAVFQPRRLDNASNLLTDRDHGLACEVKEMNGGKMDNFTFLNADVKDACGSNYNFVYACKQDVATYRSYAHTYALADRYFQPTAGASASNDIYFAAARWRFDDNDPKYVLPGFHAACCFDGPGALELRHIGALLWNAGAGFTVYAGGLQSKLYSDGDNPFAYFQDPHARDPRETGWTFTRDLGQLDDDLANGSLPSFSFVKLQDTKSEHPGPANSSLTAGIQAVSTVVDALLASSVAASTLILLTYDESGGFYDHIRPPDALPLDVDYRVIPPSDPAIRGQPLPVSYGPRVPFLAIGPFARNNYVSHVPMEHASIVKFIEWNWLAQKTGQLGARDQAANNIGSLLDPLKTGTAVPWF